MNCKEARELIHSLMDGDISSDELLKLNEHTAYCPDCRAFLESMKKQRELLRSLAPAPKRVDMLSLERKKRKIEAQKRRRVVSWVSASAAVLVVGAVSVFVISSGARKNYSAAADAAYAAEPAAYEEKAEAAYDYSSAYSAAGGDGVYMEELDEPSADITDEAAAPIYDQERSKAADSASPDEANDMPSPAETDTEVPMTEESPADAAEIVPHEVYEIWLSRTDVAALMKAFDEAGVFDMEVYDDSFYVRLEESNLDAALEILSRAGIDWEGAPLTDILIATEMM